MCPASFTCSGGGVAEGSIRYTFWTVTAIGTVAAGATFCALASAVALIVAFGILIVLSWMLHAAPARSAAQVAAAPAKDVTRLMVLSSQKVEERLIEC